MRGQAHISATSGLQNELYVRLYVVLQHVPVALHHRFTSLPVWTEIHGWNPKNKDDIK